MMTSVCLVDGCKYSDKDYPGILFCPRHGHELMDEEEIHEYIDPYEETIHTYCPDPECGTDYSDYEDAYYCPSCGRQVRRP
jgi:hypothetical protein